MQKTCMTSIAKHVLRKAKRCPQSYRLNRKHCYALRFQNRDSPI